MADTNYQPKLYRKQGGNELVIADGGEITGEDGGIIDLEDGFSFWFDGEEELTQATMKAIFQGAVSVLTITNGSAPVATSNTLSLPNIPSRYKYIIFSMYSGLVSASAYLTSGPKAGDYLYLMLKATSCASGQIEIWKSGCSLAGPGGSELTTIQLNNSTNSRGCIKLTCLEDGCWSVLDGSFYPDSTILN